MTLTYIPGAGTLVVKVKGGGLPYAQGPGDRTEDGRGRVATATLKVFGCQEQAGGVASPQFGGDSPTGYVTGVEFKLD